MMEGQEVKDFDPIDLEDDSKMVVETQGEYGTVTLQNARKAIGVTLKAVDASAIELDVDTAPTAVAVTGGTSREPTISLTYGIPKPKQIESIEQTTLAEASGGTNYITCTLNDGTSKQFLVKNGEKGDRGDSGVSIPTSGIFQVYLSEEGHLMFQTAEETETSVPFSINEEGHLIYTIGE